MRGGGHRRLRGLKEFQSHQVTIAGDPSDIKTEELQRLHGNLYILIVALRTDHVWSQIPVQIMTSKVSIKGIGIMR